MNRPKSCPDCNGAITIYTNICRGAFARCHVCKKEYPICGIEEIPVFNGCKIRKSTAEKILRMWNRRADSEPSKN